MVFWRALVGVALALGPGGCGYTLVERGRPLGFSHWQVDAFDESAPTRVGPYLTQAWIERLSSGGVAMNSSTPAQDHAILRGKVLSSHTRPTPQGSGVVTSAQSYRVELQVKTWVEVGSAVVWQRTISDHEDFMSGATTNRAGHSESQRRKALERLANKIVTQVYQQLLLSDTVPSPASPPQAPDPRRAGD